MFVYNFKDIVINKEKEICVPNKESINGRRCERTNTVYNVKYFETVCTFSKVIGLNTENKICLPNKEYISG